SREVEIRCSITDEVEKCEHQLYEGIEHVLWTLNNKGHHLGIVTSRASDVIFAESPQEQGLKKAGFFFSAQGGHSFDKEIGIHTLQKQAAKKQKYHGKTIMVGDRIFDYAGAMKASADFILCTYDIEPFPFPEPVASDTSPPPFWVAQQPEDILVCVDEIVKENQSHQFCVKGATFQQYMFENFYSDALAK
ncbi:MAG: HAD hydrolase-like protein, partial [Cyanobacteria bacterium J06649_11]